jgi:glycine/D-amino acid oxidase-like deaminating enzyme
MPGPARRPSDSRGRTSASTGHIVVVGAGVVGSSVAFHLAARGASVSIVDPLPADGGTSGASFSVTVATRKTPHAFFALAVDGDGEHDRLADRFGEASWLHRTGTLEWGGNERERAVIRERVERLHGWDHPAEWVQPSRVSDIEPELAVPDTGADEFVHYPREGWYDAVLLIRTLQQNAGALGAHLVLGQRVIAMDVSAGRVTGVRTDAGTRIPADFVVNCAGPDADRVARLAGARVPMTAVPGLVAHTPPSAVRLRSVVFASGVNVRPASDGGLVLHSYEVDRTLSASAVRAGSVATDARASLELLDRARAVLPRLASARIDAARVGIRPIPLDGLPAVGPLPGIDGLYAVVSHSAANLSPILGRLAADELLGTVHERLEPFRPARLHEPGAHDACDESLREMSLRLTAPERLDPT